MGVLDTVRQALISDIHANLEALSAVLNDIASQEVDEIVCLGDIVGYGPNPCECLDIVTRRCKFAILGNHDQAAIWDPEGFNPVALRAIYWTRDCLDDFGKGRAGVADRRWDFLNGLPKFKQVDQFLYVHGSARDPTNEYVFPETSLVASRMHEIFQRVPQYAFQGHTHMPGVFVTDPLFIPPDDLDDSSFRLGREKVMVNVGSVGQPRDEDSRACYVILDSKEMSVTFRRVPYDLETTIRKIYAINEVDNMLGDRLRSGR